MQFRPSGIRARPLTYLPALVAINQTSVIGPLKRRITPREAARLQGFDDEFRLHPDPGIAYRHLGNAVSVGVTAFILSHLVGEDQYSLLDPKWAEALNFSKTDEV